MSRERSSTTILKQKVVNFVQDDENSKKDDKYSMQESTEMTRAASEQHDWFKFETRIRTVMKEMLELSVSRS